MMEAKLHEIDTVPSNLEFNVYASEDIRRLSVVKVVTGVTFDPLGHPLSGGLYDSLMGTYGRGTNPCATCNNIQTCPGHIGHIELDALVYNPFFLKLIQRVLGIFCLHCFKIQLKDYMCLVIILQLRLVDAGFIAEAQELDVFKSANAFQNEDGFVKLETGEYVHPRIAFMVDLLAKHNSYQVENTYSTKMSYKIRSAITHSALQKTISKKCIHCQKQLRNVRLLYGRLVYYIYAAELKNNTSVIKQATGQNKAVFADECRNFLRKIYSRYADLLDLLFPLLDKRFKPQNGHSPIDLFFMETVAVTPSKARPPIKLHNQVVEHAQTAIYRSIIENNATLSVIMKHMNGQRSEILAETQVYENARGETSHEKLYYTWQLLQTSINLLLDTSASRDLSTSQGLKQILEKKEGLIRKHMMGKRVNYAARTVITPDPNINVEEVGIPENFARKLSYPIPVTPWNVAELRKMVMNGPAIHPGANYVQDDKGYTTLIPADNEVKRQSMAKLLFNYPEKGIKIVHRHIINGDVLLLNRQPSLHKPSIMAHKARILSGEKTFRLHYSNCNAYNADFDGDEMNAHIPQNETSRAEAYNLVNVANNYLVPKNGTPLGGLIQDHVIAGVKLSIRGRFFNREDYQQLIFQGLSHLKSSIKLLPPSILKPEVLWSGKQVLSTVIINVIPNGYPAINLHTQAKIASKNWITSPPKQASMTYDELCESNVIIHKGTLLSGVLDKQQYGATTYGLIHCIYELYGGDISTRLLTSFTKIFTAFLQREGFTLGVQDILVTTTANAYREKIIKESREMGSSIVATALNLEEEPPTDVLFQKMEAAYVKDSKFRILLDRKYKTVLDNITNNINRICLPQGIILKFPINNLQLMVLSGAKGSLVNTMQISSLLGQIELEGKRPPLMISGKSLPSFTSFEMSPKSGGFIDGRFMTGIQPQDFFFHCMAGREGLIDTAVKTSRSGYLQRCLIKHLEGLTVNYDLTVRDSDNSVVQFLYGEDGLDILKSKFMNTKFCIKFLAMNAAAILHSNELNHIKNNKMFLKILHHSKKVSKWQHIHNKNVQTLRKQVSPFTYFSTIQPSDTIISNTVNSNTGRRYADEDILKKWRELEDEIKNQYERTCARCPDPTVSIYQQNYYGSTSERLIKMITEYVNLHPELNNIMNDIIYIKNLKALIAPGEPVGILAAQSIGEPSTQMTLNTFHFAGRGEMNVTLGIPRLREILMLASSNINTPSMDIPIKITEMENANKLRIKLNRVTLADILHFINVNIKILISPEQVYQYHIHFQLLPRKIYKDNFGVKPKNVMKYICGPFLRLLFRAIIKLSLNKDAIVMSKEMNEEHSDNNDDSDDKYLHVGCVDNSKSRSVLGGGHGISESSDDEDDIYENDATGIKIKSRKQDENEYDDADADADADGDADDDADIADTYESNCINNDGIEKKELKNNGTLETNVYDTMVEKVMSNEMVKEYLYDKKDYQWCKLTFNLSTKYKKPDIISIIDNLARKCVVHEVENIKRSIICKDDNNTVFLKTDGINIVEMFKHHKVLNLNGLYSNDIHEIAKTYGIEAAAQVIKREVSNVFKVYGITVDKRHLSLIADYMTFDGTFQPLSRKGMEHSASPLQQMSFESCLQFLKNATGCGHVEGLSSPSSRLMVGLPVRSGTGAFELITKIC